MRLEPAVPDSVRAAIRAPFAGAGAAIDPAVIQPLGLILDLAGEAMHARLFVVQGQGGEESCLRPDFTIAVAREHIASGAAAGRYTYEGRAFRVSPAGADHPEEFLQVGLEAFGGADLAAADAEVASLAWRSASAGGRDDLSLLLGDVGLYRAFVAALGLAAPLTQRLIRAFSRPRTMGAELERAQSGDVAERQGDRIASLLAGLPETEAVAVLQDLWALAGVQQVGGRSAGEIAHRLIERSAAASAPRLTEAEAGLIRRYLEISGEPRAALAQIAALGVNLDGPLGAWSQRLDALEAAGAPRERMSFATGFGRAFGYYDGMLFEVRSAALGEGFSVAGGGRYDALPVRLGGGQTGAVGCMVRPARAWSGALS
ncbi:ATP phosphoribosyltransferase regulatory subunit [Phenylobacterium montanum]|uniref:ATP phosphoribosyltransferase regulatory subunit n=1 Tax=Phenylobacterium montanum TaxID=2823693 RepID=A0A975FXE0_9CAUL|nr:ATP phosphoribosyltransferase regulatory subunit [Caulobacter sp. S6]QUD87055.1 ATP phosphoribosyltransferase regulatory subunit [Caulobacter sp. S6]